MEDLYNLTSIYGLSNEQVEKKKEAGKQNIQTKTITKSIKQILKDNICTTFNLLNIMIAIALALVGAWSNMLFILIIILNTIIGIIQEIRAKKMVDELSLLTMPSAKVIRDGKIYEFPIEELVEEDVIQLESGHQICNDAIILTGKIEVNESLLTGEADPIVKSAGDHVLSGSFVVSGKCRACIEHVGEDNYAVQMANEAKKMRPIQSELLASMRKVTRITGYLIPPLGISLFLEAYFLRHTPLNTTVVSIAAGLLGMLPKGLVLLTSISSAIGIIHLSKRKILIQKLYSLETLAHVDTLCLDKTGTITQGKMCVEKIVLNDFGKSVPFEDWIGCFLHNTEDTNATFQALNEYFSKNEYYIPINRIPFSSERKWSGVEFEKIGTIVIGAPERFVTKEFEEEIKEEMKEGKRVLLCGVTSESVDSHLPHSLKVMGMIVITDPIRPNIHETLMYFKNEGVDLKLISGDNPMTVAALAKQAGFSEADNYVDMSQIDEAEIKEAAIKYAIFGRTTPLQKKKLVQALQEKGHSVAMSGDGVNDLLALRQADCSIAVAEGSDAARQISQVILLDSNFASLPLIMNEGRRVVNDITRVAGIFFVKTIYSILLSIACLILNAPFPFIPIQITLIDLIIEGYPSFFMTFEKDTRKVNSHFIPAVMKRALPNAISILVCYLLLNLISDRIYLSSDQFSTLFYLLVGNVGIQAVIKASLPFNRLRSILCITVIVGFYIAVYLFHTILELALPSLFTISILVIFILSSFLIERMAAIFINKVIMKQ